MVRPMVRRGAGHDGTIRAATVNMSCGMGSHLGGLLPNVATPPVLAGFFKLKTLRRVVTQRRASLLYSYRFTTSMQGTFSVIGPF